MRRNNRRLRTRPNFEEICNTITAADLAYPRLPTNPNNVLNEVQNLAMDPTIPTSPAAVAAVSAIAALTAGAAEAPDGSGPCASTIAAAAIRATNAYNASADDVPAARATASSTDSITASPTASVPAPTTASALGITAGATASVPATIIASAAGITAGSATSATTTSPDAVFTDSSNSRRKNKRLARKRSLPPLSDVPTSSISQDNEIGDDIKRGLYPANDNAANTSLAATSRLPVVNEDAVQESVAQIVDDVVVFAGTPNNYMARKKNTEAEITASTRHTANQQPLGRPSRHRTGLPISCRSVFRLRVGR